MSLTGIAYGIGLRLRHLARGHALANPTVVAMALVALVLWLTRTPYSTYFKATWLLTFLLAPATVALGIPLARNFRHIRHCLPGVVLGLLAGSVASMLSGVLLVRLFGGSREVALSMLPKAITTPIAMLVSGQIGGQPALTASLAMIGGITAALTLQAVLRVLRVSHGHAVGLAAGTAGSGLGAAQVAPLGDGTAAFAAIGIGLNGLITALLAPFVAAFLK
jgi:putative effector of murein hydrolase